MTSARLLVAIALLAVLGAGDALACATHRFTVGELADGAARVVDGRIVRARSYWTDEPRRIETEITLAGVRDLKDAGADADDDLTIIVPGGTVGDTTMRLCCAPALAVGQRWVMFLQPEYRTYPTVAMGQGLFRVVADGAGAVRVLSSGGAPIAGLSARGVPHAAAVESRDAAADRSSPVRPAGGGVRAVSVRRLASPGLEGAMTLEAFEAAIAPALRDSQRHAVGGLVARPIRPRLEATALVPAPGPEHADEAPAPREEDAR
jgi:hypothetical protein